MFCGPSFVLLHISNLRGRPMSRTAREIRLSVFMRLPFEVEELRADAIRFSELTVVSPLAAGRTIGRGPWQVLLPD